MADAPSRDSFMTVRDALALPSVARGVPEVVAGAEGLDRAIRWVHSGEVPYMPEMLKGGELLLMTGIAIRRGAGEQRRFVAQLAELGIAGLVIELGPRFRRAPRALVEEAEETAMPLIALHHEIRFVEVAEAVNRELVSRQVELLRRGNELHERFTALMLEGAGIPEVLAELAAAVGNPVILERSDGELAYHAPHETDDATVLAAWEGYARGLPGAPAGLDLPVPAADGERSWGRLVALAIEAGIDQWARVALERALGLVALALLRDRAEQQMSSRAQGRFLAGLLEPEVDEAEARQRALALGFPEWRGAILPVAIGRAPRAERSLSGGGAGEAWSALWRGLRDELQDRGVPALSGARAQDSELLLVAGLRRPGGRAELAELLAGLLAEQSARRLGSRSAAILCVGPSASGWRALGAGLRVAVESLPAALHARTGHPGMSGASGEAAGRPRARQAGPSSWYDATLPDLDGLLWGWRERPELRRFVAARLDPLLEHDRRRRSALLPTVVALCEHGGHKAEAARALGIERQSLYNRLARIEEILGADLSDPNTMLTLHLALRARQAMEG